MPQLRYAQLRYLSIVLLSWASVFLLTRGALLIAHWGDAGASGVEIVRIFAVGLAYDATFLLYATLPLALYLLICPHRLWKRRGHRVFLHLLLGISLFVMLFTATAEWLFWDEFGVRFNFIAVDYLVYSEEVINNILESYPVYPLIAALALAAVFLAVALRKPVSKALSAPLMPHKTALGAWGLLFAGALLGTLAVNQNFPRGLGGNAYQNELASNGPFQFFAAFRNNELDYMKFYATLPAEQVGSLLRQEVAESNTRFVNDDPEDIRRVVDNPGPEQRHNVVLVTVESLSARYLGAFGDPRGLTPNLDALSKQSLFFSNLYATGTRTDRGLEAITLSMPPTPGRSIVKRIGRESGYASLGQQFKDKGYDSVFMYGGRGYFDNMNAFFGGNGYRIVDQSSVASDEMTFQNAWGMSDEDLYTQTLRVADADHAAGKPFFLQLMTTSNHRPYTYPEGRIDIPSGRGREGALKYTDYAIGRFLAEAKSKPWFANTLFVFVADHTAGSAGKEDLPVANYHIPMFIYGPGIVTPAEVTRLTSQIDIAPTLLGLMGFDYTSTFFGHNVLRDDAPAGRALIGNYQHLGLFDGQDLAILSPKRAMRRHDDALGISREQVAAKSDRLVERDIAYYQGASHNFTHDLLSWHPSHSATVASHP
ncbi:LTA synthase family protein [Phytopseudomonas punonensis]|uniref:Phosphoglycerol transferase MdoB n=1 Tax=Phytopseudomonas punonensis TaxID=1220495 RepID=A0A1M7K9K7_9GAMM|nr:LTA synthase family protein [Pseudomonas punonensis]SHM61946.1 Phosphoglycerol transferase MdoB [Pseudomonas punonensis]